MPTNLLIGVLVANRVLGASFHNPAHIPLSSLSCNSLGRYHHQVIPDEITLLKGIEKEFVSYSLAAYWWGSDTYAFLASIAVETGGHSAYSPLVRVSNTATNEVYWLRYRVNLQQQWNLLDDLLVEFDVLQMESGSENDGES